jgi:L-fuconolactonase
MQLRIDAHMHLWEVARGDYDWLDFNDPGLAPIARDFNVSDAIVVFTKNGIKGSVLVQAAATDAETQYMLGLADRHEVIRGVVGWVDLSDAASALRIEILSQNKKFKGVRPMLQNIEDVNWIATQPKREAVQALITAGLKFDALVLPQHLSALLNFATSYPDLPIVIDHAAKPALAADPSDPRRGMWRDGMKRLAAETNAMCKLSGLLTELGPSQLREAETHLKPVVDDLLEWFGPERLMWGSDWPVVNLANSYLSWADLSAKLLSARSEAELKAIFETTAKRFYALEDAE